MTSCNFLIADNFIHFDTQQIVQLIQATSNVTLFVCLTAPYQKASWKYLAVHHEGELWYRQVGPTHGKTLQHSLFASFKAMCQCLSSDRS